MSDDNPSRRFDNPFVRIIFDVVYESPLSKTFACKKLLETLTCLNSYDIPTNEEDLDRFINLVNNPSKVEFEWTTAKLEQLNFYLKTRLMESIWGINK